MRNGGGAVLVDQGRRREAFEGEGGVDFMGRVMGDGMGVDPARAGCRFEARSEEHTSELQSRRNLVCRLLLEKKKLQTDCEILMIN